MSPELACEGPSRRGSVFRVAVVITGRQCPQVVVPAGNPDYMLGLIEVELDILMFHLGLNLSFLLMLSKILNEKREKN